MTQHTEGPWNWTGMYVEDADGMPIARVHCNQVSRFDPDGRLIAAAPDLADFAREFLAWRDAPIKGTGHTAYIEMLDRMARAAHAKASG